MENEQSKEQPSISHRRKKQSLTDTEKAQIYNLHQENPLVTHSDIAGMDFSAHYSYFIEANSGYVEAIFRVDRSTVSKILQSNPFPSTATRSSHEFGIPAETVLQQPSRNEDALINWAHATERSGTHVTRNMIRRQAAILAAEQWKSAQNTGSHLGSCTSADTPNTSLVDSFDLSNPLMSLDWLNRDLAGATNTCPPPTFREEACISDLLPYCTSGLSCDPDIGQHEVIAGCTENFCLDSGNIGEIPTMNLADHQGSHHTAHQLANCTASLGPGDPAIDVGLEARSAITDEVCQHEARRALFALEHYLAGLPGQTSLDQLCLNHLRGRLGRSGSLLGA